MEKFEINLLNFGWNEWLQKELQSFENEMKKLDNMDFGKKIAESINKRFCQVCFFGSVIGRVEGVNLCRDCIENMYECEEYNGKQMPTKRKNSYEWHVRRRRQDAFEYFWRSWHENAFLRTRLDEMGVDSDNEIRTKLYDLDPLPR